MSTLQFAALAARPTGHSPELMTLREDQRLGGFTARALFTDAVDQPIGARFVHESRMTVDVLYFASVPQASITVRTLPVSDKGESHTGEHLLIGKGTKGGYINALLGMRLAEHTAGTYKDATNYQFVCSAGMEGFFELLEAYLGALIQPDFTDEEIRREVANFEAVADRDGRLHLQEKGTVYNEMVSTMEKAHARAWYRLERLIFGEGHPIARVAGGDPAGIRALTPGEVRRFLGSRYHIGPNLSLIIALPVGQPLEAQLSRLEAVIARVEPAPPPVEREKVPPSSPGLRGEISIGTFPSDDPNLPQTVLLGFSPLENASVLDLLRAQLVLGLIGGGETSYLHHDLVDRATRDTDAGITDVWAWIDSPPLAYPVMGLSGLPPRFIEMKTLAALRERVLLRIRWLASLEPGSRDLAQALDKARSSMRSLRRGYLRFIDSPPHFGVRHGGGIGWQRHLDLLADQPGFRKAVPLSDAIDQIERELIGGENPFRAAIERAGLTETPWVSAVTADATLLQCELAEREERLAAQVARLAAQYGTEDAQEALERFQADTEANTREIEARQASIGKPRFVTDPPLTLDDLDFETARLPSGKQIVRAIFGTTSFTRITLDFDLTGLPPDAVELLPILPEVLTELGAIAPDGEKLDYIHADERIRSEIHGLGAQLSANPVTGRAELNLSAGASTADEVDRALAWMESYLFHPVLAADSQNRLLDLISRGLKGGRGIFQAAEEMWVQGAAAAYVYEDQSVYMALASPFTRLRYLARARARLDDADAATRAARQKALERIEALVQSGDRQQIADALGDLGAELADDFRFELDHLPDDRLAPDLTRLVREARADLAVAPEKTISRLKQLLSFVIVQDGVRVSLTGSSANLARAERGVRKLIARLPAGSARSGTPARVPIVSHRLAERYPGLTPETRPVHVALVNNGATTATHVILAPAPSWRSRGLNDMVDRLAAGVLAGAGPHSLFMRTWAAGLAYSNGLRASPDSAQLGYYAERCPDPVEIMRFVADIASRQTVDRNLVEYALADAFGDYRADRDFFARGSAIADDLADGTTPEVVREFKQSLIKAARDPEAASLIAARLPDAVGRVIVGFGEKVSSVRGAVAFVVAPEPLIARYEQHLVEIGEADRLVRLYPRDFWPDPDPALPSMAKGPNLDPEIEALDLAPTAKKAAYELKKAHPSVVFTSGRRNKRDQARAMSENVILNRKWIEQTYAKTIASDNCQKWVDDNPDKTTQGEIEAGLASVIDALPDAKLARLSKHLSGDAFDVQPVVEDAEKIKATIRSLPGLKVFLDMEGGLIRWHAQF